MNKAIAYIAFVVLLAGCAGHGTSAPIQQQATHSSARAPQQTGGPGHASLTYYDTLAVTGPCNPGVLTIMNSYTVAQNLSFPAGQGPPLTVSNCNFSTPQYVRVTLGTPSYGIPFVRQSGYTATVDAPAAAQVTATWTALGPTLPGTPGLSGTVNYTIGPAADQTLLWQTGNGSLGQYVLASPDDGQCSGVGPVISGNDASFTVLRNTNKTYDYNGTTYNGASTCWRNQMNPIDQNTGSNVMLTMGTQYRYTFRTIVRFNGNVLYQGHQGGGIDVDIPAIVWQTHSWGENPGTGPCDMLDIGNTYVAYANGVTQYGVVPQGGQAIWHFHTCSDPSSFSGYSYNSPDTLYEGEQDDWQIDITAQLDGHSGGSVVVQRNGQEVYNAPSGVCDSAAVGCWWNFGPYMYYWPNTGEPPNWNNAGVTVQFSDMTFTTPNGAQPLSRRRGAMGSLRKT